MRAVVSFTMPKANHSLIKTMGANSVSHYMEAAFKEFLEGRLEITEDDLKSIRSSCTTSPKVAQALQDKADELGIPVSKLARAITDKSVDVQMQLVVQSIRAKAAQESPPLMN